MRQAILTQGWSDQAGAYTQAFGSTELDASTLLLATTGFLPTDDARLLATIDAVERNLADERGLIFRYRGDDGLEGTEGTFLLCSFWLAHALAVNRPDHPGPHRARPRRRVCHRSGPVLRTDRHHDRRVAGQFPKPSATSD